MLNPEIIKAIVLGIVQGITEFFPISSTAHLILFPWFFGWSGEIDTLSFDIALHGGTLLSLLVCFARDWVNLLVNDRRTLAYLAIATVPAGVAGLALKHAVETTFRSPLIIVFTLIAVGIVMLLAERWSRDHAGRLKKKASFADAIIIGAAQAVALIPGVSRSGITITAGLWRHLTRESAARFSFLLSTPVIAGATLLEAKKLAGNPGSYDAAVFIAGFIASFLAGVLAIRFLLSYLKNHPLNLFVYYRFLLALVILVVYIRQL